MKRRENENANMLISTARKSVLYGVGATKDASVAIAVQLLMAGFMNSINTYRLTA